jgi:hypothetical protein
MKENILETTFKRYLKEKKHNLLASFKTWKKNGKMINLKLSPTRRRSKSNVL